MKKAYITPRTEIIEESTASMLAASNSIMGPEGTKYGGIDTNGIKDPDSRFLEGIWDEDDEDW